MRSIGIDVAEQNKKPSEDVSLKDMTEQEKKEYIIKKSLNQARALGRSKPKGGAVRDNVRTDKYVDDER